LKPASFHLGFSISALLALLACAVTPSAWSLQPPPNADQHWAFQSPAPVKLPKIKNTAWPKTTVDPFILAKLEAAGLTPAPPADPRTLIRRMSFDLIGLPPTEAEVNQFIAAAKRDRQAAVIELADRLLASPHYGERWGRHWLDIARYSDTKGYVYAREERFFVHAPAYRDWVIRAFNDDLPYDRFLLLQIAADQLCPPDSTDLAALGFITGGRRFLGVTHDIIDDRVDVVTRGTMGLTVQCARCHDHKYDPITSKDYYSLYGVFHGSDDRLVELKPSDDAELAKRRLKFNESMQKRRDEAGSRLRTRVGDYLAAQLEMEKYPEEGFDQFLSPGDLIPASVRRWRDFLQMTKANTPQHPIFAPWFVLRALPEDGFATNAAPALAPLIEGGKLNPGVASAFGSVPKSLREAATLYGKIFADAAKQTNAPGAAELLSFLNAPASPTVVPDNGIINNEVFFPTTVTEALWKLQGEIDRRLIELGTPAALVVNERPPEPNPRVFNRGKASRLGEEIPRQFLHVLDRKNPKPFQHGNGRLELAQAIAHPNNPLTARVMVNRIWQHHFGAGLVRTPSDFGLRAEPPSHPELLDWLAQRFVAEGWSVKAMHRLIVSSAAYQQSSAPLKASTASRLNDPENRLLTHYPVRRLEFETLRDSMLATSGELDPKMGGKPSELLDASNKRRTVYALVDRQFLPGTFRTFDFANPDIHVAVRHETTIPQQALFFLNGNFAANRAKALTKKFADAPPAERVQKLHHALYQRNATKNEVTTALQFIAAAQSEQPPAPEPIRETQWRYGTGEYDEAAKRLKSFTKLPHFTGTAWQGAATLPGGASGWAQLTAEGGHPGNTRALACVRRWIAPRDTTVSITGTLKHEPEQGDGVRGFIVSSRDGELKAAKVHHSKTNLSVANISVKAGDTIDFVVDIGDTLSYDQFLWSPLITAADTKWDARAEFNGPSPLPVLLTPWEQYAQVLLLANEFAFAD
jgi:Protein of unknown function (DUF1553)/Protein of unknown function (DUF1549)